MARYDQCDSTCTTDCGHCKGAGHPDGRADRVLVQPPPTPFPAARGLDQYVTDPLHVTITVRERSGRVVETVIPAAAMLETVVVPAEREPVGYAPSDAFARTRPVGPPRLGWFLTPLADQSGKTHTVRVIEP